MPAYPKDYVMTNFYDLITLTPVVELVEKLPELAVCTKAKPEEV